MGKIVRNYIYNASYQILVLFAPMLTAPYLARVLGASQMGIYSYVSSFTNIICTISLLGIYTYGNRQIAYDRNNQLLMSKNFWEIMLCRLVLGIIGTIFFCVIAVLDSDYFLFFISYYPYAVAMFIDCSWVYVGMEDMRPAVMKNFCAKLISICLIFILVKGETDIWIYLLILGTTTLFANIAVYTQLSKYVVWLKPSLCSIKKHIIKSIVLFFPEMAAMIYLQIDKIMLRMLSTGISEVSFYDQAEKIITIPLTFITVISTTVMPRIANEYANCNKEQIRKLLIVSGKCSLLLAFPMMTGLAFISEQFIPWYLGKEFLPTVLVIQLLAPIVISNSLVGISGTQYFTATNQTKILSKAYILAVIVNVIINILLIPQYGYKGAAIATVVSSYVSLVIQYFYFSQQIKIQELFVPGIRYLIGSVIMILCLKLLTGRLKAQIMTTFIQVLLGVLIYLIYLFVINDDILENFIGRIKK